MAAITFDTSDFDAKSTQLIMRAKANVLQAVNAVATEVLRLSQFEVPHDIGTLQNSGHIEEATNMSEPEAIVGYNTPYAAYQHEGHRMDGTHIIQHYQAGRKGKYLEDPIRRNLGTFKQYFAKILN